MRLSASQQIQLTRVTHAATWRGRFPALLLTGPTGCGKRTVARFLAGTLDSDFEEVPVQDVPENLLSRLIGTMPDAERARDSGVAPGLLGRDGRLVLFLAGLQDLPRAVTQRIRSIIVERRYEDQLGIRWNMSDDVLIIGSRHFSSQSSIPPHHWLWTAFDRRLDIDTPASTTDIEIIATNMLQELGGSAAFSEDETILNLLCNIAASGDHLHMLRRILESAVSHNPMRPIRTCNILDQLSSDARWLLARIRYRGQPLTEATLKDWLAQFPAVLQPVAFQVFRAIADHYYIGSDFFHAALENLIRSSGIPPHARVSFCRWQPLGASGARMAHTLKNQANWKCLSETDLTANGADWDDLGTKSPEWYIIVDDMIGSGNTIRTLTRGPDAPVRLLLHRFPHARLRIMSIVAFEDALRAVRDDLADFLTRVDVASHQLLSSRDQCFSSQSRILPNPTHREALLEFCLNGCDNRIRLRRALRLGHQDMATAVVFQDTVPNNSLPILWYASQAWTPLFPVSGLAGPLNAAPI